MPPEITQLGEMAPDPRFPPCFMQPFYQILPGAFEPLVTLLKKTLDFVP